MSTFTHTRLHMHTCHPTFKQVPLPVKLLFCNIARNYCWAVKHIGSGYDYSVKLFTGHFFAKIVQVIKPQLQSLQWKKTLCVCICIFTHTWSRFSSMIKFFFLCFSTYFFSELEDFKNTAARQLCCSRKRDKSPPTLCTSSHYFYNFATRCVSANTVSTCPFFTLSELALHLGGSLPAGAEAHHPSQFPSAIAAGTAPAHWGWPQPRLRLCSSSTVLPAVALICSVLWQHLHNP